MVAHGIPGYMIAMMIVAAIVLDIQLSLIIKNVSFTDVNEFYSNGQFESLVDILCFAVILFSMRILFIGVCCFVFSFIPYYHEWPNTGYEGPIIFSGGFMQSVIFCLLLKFNIGNGFHTTFAIAGLITFVQLVIHFVIKYVSEFGWVLPKYRTVALVDV